MPRTQCGAFPESNRAPTAMTSANYQTPRSAGFSRKEPAFGGSARRPPRPPRRHRRFIFGSPSPTVDGGVLRKLPNSFSTTSSTALRNPSPLTFKPRLRVAYHREMVPSADHRATGPSSSENTRTRRPAPHRNRPPSRSRTDPEPTARPRTHLRPRPKNREGPGCAVVIGPE